jgi:DNA-binding PadR family transcriptional regulator
MVRYALLGLLREQRDYGYRLKLRFDERVGTAWHLNIGQVYQTLRALQRAKLVAEVGEGTSDGQHPARRMFELTPKGARTLERWLQRPPVRLRPVRDEMLIRLLVVAPERRPEVIERLNEQELQYSRQLARLHAQQRRQPSNGDPEHVVRGLSLEAALLHTEAHLRWLAYCREYLESLAAGLQEPTTAADEADDMSASLDFELPAAATA